MNTRRSKHLYKKKIKKGLQTFKRNVYEGNKSIE